MMNLSLLLRGWISFLLTLMVAIPVGNAHKGETHDTGISVEQKTTDQPGQDTKDLPFSVGGDFELINHDAMPVTNRSYHGKYMLVFFGYTNCKNMCPLTLSRVGKALELIGSVINRLSPLVITIDPERDTPAVLRRELPKYHPALIGLTGSENQLAQAYASYSQSPQQIEDDWDDDTVVSHSSYIYLMDENGQFVTLFPPILNPQSMANIISKHLGDAT